MNRKLFLKKTLLGIGGFAVANSILSCLSDDFEPYETINEKTESGTGKKNVIYVVDNTSEFKKSKTANPNREYKKNRKSIEMTFTVIGYIIPLSQLSNDKKQNRNFIIEKYDNENIFVKYRLPIVMDIPKGKGNKNFKYIIHDNNGYRSQAKAEIKTYKI